MRNDPSTLVPGTVPGLLRPGLRAHVRVLPGSSYRATGIVCWPGRREGAWEVWWRDGGASTVEDDMEACDIELDLADEVNYAHAARWLTERTLSEDGKRHIAGGVIWRGPGIWTPNDERGRSVAHWVLHGWTSMDGAQFVGDEKWAWSRERHVVHLVPELEELDGMDPLVDAKALALCVRHFGDRA